MIIYMYIHILSLRFILVSDKRLMQIKIQSSDETQA